MSRVDVHPEELIDAARRGEIDASGRQRLDSHVAHCTACAAELAFAKDFEAATAPKDGDDMLLAGMVSAALIQTGIPATATGEVARTAATGGKAVAAKGISLELGAALAVGVLGGAAAALWMTGALDGSPEPTPDMPTVVVTPEPEQPAPADVVPEPEQPAPADVVPEPEEGSAPPQPEPTVAEPELAVDEEPVAQPAPERSRADVAPERQRPARLGANEMLERANAARRGGDYREAERWYRSLQRVHGSSREAAVSRVTLGRLYLDGLGQPARALEQFEGYLSQRPRGVLAEEARVGRALALARLGRTAEEQNAWRELLRHHPDSLHAERARSRLEP